MTRCQSSKTKWPVVWLMTDPRFGDDLLPAIRRLPFRSGVIFRHYNLDPLPRRKLFGTVRRICRLRGHMLILAGPEQDAMRWRADGFHSREGKAKSSLPHTAPVHNRTELAWAQRNGTGLFFISPLFPTQSHRDGKALGRLAFNALAKQAGKTAVIALGGMDRCRALNTRLAHGWAAIDAFRKNRI